jgi:hypothetical protein
MAPINWDRDNERLLLLQIMAINDIKVTTAQWHQIAQMWNNGSKGDAFRKHFTKLKGEATKQMEASGMVTTTEQVASPMKSGLLRGCSVD